MDAILLVCSSCRIPMRFLCRRRALHSCHEFGDKGTLNWTFTGHRCRGVAEAFWMSCPPYMHSSADPVHSWYYNILSSFGYTWFSSTELKFTTTLPIPSNIYWCSYLIFRSFFYQNQMENKYKLWFKQTHYCYLLEYKRFWSYFKCIRFSSTDFGFNVHNMGPEYSNRNVYASKC